MQAKPIARPSRPIRDRLVLAASSAGGLGYLPVAPGTFGTLAALPLWWWMASWSWAGQAVLVVAVGVAAIWVSECAEEIYGEHDVGKIVIDEVAGMLVTVLAVPFEWPQIVTAFIVFRLLDMLKPPPIRAIDRHVEGGFGVVLDDLLAGAIGCGLLHLARLLHGGWW